MIDADLEPIDRITRLVDPLSGEWARSFGELREDGVVISSGYNDQQSEDDDDALSRREE